MALLAKAVLEEEVRRAERAGDPAAGLLRALLDTVAAGGLTQADMAMLAREAGAAASVASSQMARAAVRREVRFMVVVALAAMLTGFCIGGSAVYFLHVSALSVPYGTVCKDGICWVPVKTR